MSQAGDHLPEQLSVSGVIKDGVLADAQPHNVWFARPDLLPITKRRSAIRRPSHLPHVLSALDSLDPQARRELRRARSQSRDKLVTRCQERMTLLAGQFAHVALKAR